MSSNKIQAIALGLALAAATSLLLYQLYQQSAEDTGDQSQSSSANDKRAEAKSRGLPQASPKPPPSTTTPSQAATPVISNASTNESQQEKSLHNRIEDLDRKGKALFKAKKFLEAAQVFTEALQLIESESAEYNSTSLARQAITLTNNRSAMYEKAGLPDLALEDCRTILEEDVGHEKARTRRLRILESQKNYSDALIEVCALQLKFLQDNRDKIRMGIEVKPPVPQSKLEEFLQELLPAEVERYVSLQKGKKYKSLPSRHTLTQLLKSFSSYNSWMAAAARSGNIDSLTQSLQAETDASKKASLFLKRGRRYVYEEQYKTAIVDFEAGLELVVDDPGLQTAMEGGDYARLLEWTAMGRHWQYDLDGALQCYDRCFEQESTNVDILVKQAGVKMDGGKQEEALTLFEQALGLDPNSTDAMLHRANLYMLQQNVPKAKADLERCLELRPDHTLARLRLATISMATNDMDGAKKSLEQAEKYAPDSAEVHSYKGELYFAQGQVDEAKKEFDIAMRYESGNPTPYVNTALAVMNTPTATGLPDAPKAIELLEKAIEIDPQFHAAYVHLGQLKLSLASNLSSAREVIKLYDQGLEHCRSPEEIKDLAGMRVLTVAQVDAATNLKMETFNLQ